MKRLLIALLQTMNLHLAVGQTTQVHPPLWRLEKDGFTSFVIGTAHLPFAEERIPAYLNALIKTHNNFLDESDEIRTFQFKFAAQRGERPSIRRQLGMFSRDWRDLKDLVRKNVLNQMAWWSIVGVPMSTWKVESAASAAAWMSPGLLLTMAVLTGTDMNKIPGVDPRQPSLDARLNSYAKDWDRTITHLDKGWDLPPNVIDAIDKASIDDLKNALKNLREGKQGIFFADLLHALETGEFNDFVYFLDQINKDVTATPVKVLAENLLRRDLEWIATIDEYHHKAGAVIAAGMGHFISSASGASLLDHLRDRGYIATYIPVEERSAFVLPLSCKEQFMVAH